MISNATISETAKSLSKSYWLSPKRTADSAVEHGFKKGINWFLDNLWHPASEEPDTDKQLLIEYVFHDKKCYGMNVNDNNKWARETKAFNYVRWLYIDDLLREPVQNTRCTDIKIRCSTCKHRQLVTTKNYVYGGCDLQSDDYHTSRCQKRYGCSDWEMSDETKQQKRQNPSPKSPSA